MVVILLSSPLQSQYDTNVTPDKKATLMTGAILLADSMLEVYHEWELEKCLPFLYINLNNEIYYLFYAYWIRGSRLKKLLINCYYTEKYGLVGPF